MATIVVDSNSEFYNTYRLYRDYIGYTKPFSYRKWMRLDDKFKAAALYVQFYNEITLAWYKVKTQWSIEEEGVECINQYLIKNVEKIKSDSKRFSPRYIYKVAYNCLYCVCIDPSKNKDRYYNETPSTFAVGDDEMDWFDVLGEAVDHEKESAEDQLRDFFESLEGELPIYLEYLMGEATDTQICRKLKKAGFINGDTRNEEYRDYVLAYLDKLGSAKLRAQVNQFFGDFNLVTA